MFWYENSYVKLARHAESVKPLSVDGSLVFDDCLVNIRASRFGALYVEVNKEVCNGIDIVFWPFEFLEGVDEYLAGKRDLVTGEEGVGDGSFGGLRG